MILVIFSFFGSSRDPLRAPGGSVRGSCPQFPDFYTPLSNTFQARPFLKFSLNLLWNYEENYMKTAFTDGTLIPLSIPGSLVMNNWHELTFPHEMWQFSYLASLHKSPLHEKMQGWAKNLVIPPLLELQWFGEQWQHRLCYKVVDANEGLLQANQ